MYSKNNRTKHRIWVPAYLSKVVMPPAAHALEVNTTAMAMLKISTTSVSFNVVGGIYWEG
jgi:hypothetical protein